MKTRNLMSFIFLIGIKILSAHNIKTDNYILGLVIDQNNTPIENVGIYNKTTGDNSFTDAEGHFEARNISIGDVVIFYNLGFETKNVIITEKELNKTLTVILEETALSLDQVVLTSKINALSTVVDVDIKTTPIKSAQEILRRVPGLIIGQHAGGGKAEQLFLRGFDIDHGTDVAIQVDGLPVNLVSHAHGQGYSDLHFVIPETINNIDFGKGTYYADKGNFNTAGYVDLKLKKTVEKNQISLEIGQFNTLRAASLINVFDSENSSAYVAAEALLTDGVFESPQNFNRFNK